MGISLEAWRAAIGQYGRRRYHPSCSLGKGKWMSTIMPTLAVVVVLLVIGNIEVNPGPLNCKFASCEVETDTIASSVRHQLYHSNDSNFMFFCPAPDCFYLTKSFNALHFHVSTFHRKERHEVLYPEEAADKISCAALQCSFTTDSLWVMVQHVCKHLDQGSSEDSIPCPVNDCHVLFRKSSTLRVHMSQYHKGWRDEGCPPKKMRVDETPGTGSGTSEIPTDSAEQDFGFNVGQDFGFDFGDEVDDWQLLNDDLLVDKIAKFYLQLYGEFLIPYSTVQEISSSISFISGLINLRIKTILKDELKSLGIDPVKVNELCHKISTADILFTSHHKNAPGSNLSTDYLRRQYFKKFFNFIEPAEFDLSKHMEPDQKLQYVSIRDTLEIILKDSVVQKDIDNSFSRPSLDTNEISDYTDGYLFKKENHPKKEIHLLLYQDSFNAVMNALGSAKDKYKTLAMYFTLGNLKPSNRSKIDSKHLVLLVRETVFKEVTAQVCFEELLKELKLLQEVGIYYKEENVKVKVILLLGDNLGQHVMGGFIESFTSVFFCRHCDMEKRSFKNNPAETNPPRNTEDHAGNVQEAIRTNQCYRGVKGECVFDQLDNFHAVSHLPPCLAHDLFEGVVSWDLAGIIRCFVRKGWFTYKLLNDRIRKFKANGIDKSNAPATVRCSGKMKFQKLGGHAVQNWSLLRLLPFIIGDKIQDFQDPAYKLYLLLKQLCEFFCAPSFLRTDVPYVQDVLLPLYFEQHAEVLDQTVYKLRPKHHFMSHMPELMLRYGPLIHLWTLGYEQKHKFFKQVCRISRNFINVEYTCASRHQFNLAYKSTGPLFPEGCIEFKPSEFSLDSYCGELGRLLNNMPITKTRSCHKCQGVDVDGVMYATGSLILLGAQDNIIQCGKIELILVADSEVQFVLRCITATFNSNVGIFQLPPDAAGDLQVIDPRSLKYAQPQPTYDFNDKECFSVKGKVI